MRKLSKKEKVFDKVICLGCGWVGNSIDELTYYGACPACGYESGTSPWRLQTLREMLGSSEEAGYMNVRLDLFLKAIFHLLSPDEETNDDLPK